jgi:hypothetical protein
MYGMVNRSLEDMVTAQHGEEEWEAIKTEAGIDIDVFVSIEAYPDQVTYSLVAAAANRLGISTVEFLESFGVHWVTQTADRHYGGLMWAGGSTLPEFLHNLNTFHERVSLIFPYLDPPSFACTDISDNSVRLHYYSFRPGLTHFVKGLLLGLGLRFGTPVSVAIAADRSTGSDHDEFLVSW